MTLKRTLTIIAAFALGLTAVAQESPELIKQRILAQAQSLSADDYAFTRTSRTESDSNGKAEKRVTVEKFDPRKSGDARWTLVSVDGGAPPTDALARYQKESAKRRVPGYYRLANYFGASATSSKDSRGRTVFRFEGLPKGSVQVMDNDVSQNATAEVSVGDANGTPFAEQVRITIKPTRVKLVMKIDRFESTARYRIGADGKPVLAEATSEMSGSGMGQSGTIRTSSTYSEYMPARGR
jgi:hypothetical protein